MKILYFICILSVIGLHSAYADSDTSADVVNSQFQNQTVYTIVLPGGTANVGVQYQEQSGLGTSLPNSFAYDTQAQGESILGTDSTLYSVGGASGGTYKYSNNQAALTVQMDNTKFIDSDGVVGIQGAITGANGNATTYTYGIIQNGDWYMENSANSINRPTSVNIGGTFKNDLIPVTEE